MAILHARVKHNPKLEVPLRSQDHTILEVTSVAHRSFRDRQNHGLGDVRNGVDGMRNNALARCIRVCIGVLCVVARTRRCGKVHAIRVRAGGRRQQRRHAVVRGHAQRTARTFVCLCTRCMAW